MPDRVVSDLYGPVIGAIYVLMLPIWLLLLLNTWSSTRPDRTVMLVACLILVVASLTQFVKGLMLFRQHVEADDAGVRLTGLGAFDVPWDDVESVSVVPLPRTGNVHITLRPGVKVPSDYVLWRSGKRRVGVLPEKLDALTRVAAAHGVQVTTPQARPH